MKIVLMADNRKTELLVNFCIAYKTLLTKHQLISVYSTAKYLKQAVDIDVSGLNVDYLGGIEQLASRAEFDEIDCVIYLRDAAAQDNEVPSDLLKTCDMNNIPYATNLATAEILVLAVDRGDLDYRNWLKETKVS
ncbi:MAG: methylglyoxal synthase [Saccharofermentans sp.]|nr:methylglyoxal synthase [Saccharofermentans sp.]